MSNNSNWTNINKHDAGIVLSIATIFFLLYFIGVKMAAA